MLENKSKYDATRNGKVNNECYHSYKRNHT